MNNIPNVKKILVLGCSGSGKSTFARKLHDLTGLPLIHLDNVWWKPDRTHITRDAFDRELDRILEGGAWIIDGDYSRTYEVRLRACEAVFFLDFSEEQCLNGITERIGKERPDIPWTENTPDPELIRLVKAYRTENRPKLCELFRKYPEKRIIVFRSRQEADQWLESGDPTVLPAKSPVR
ncbi:MAG: adenylate kinase [Lachnospiraceae bacterium]|nr:adenylate kinase [Lachnospiraceae bacterium]